MGTREREPVAVSAASSSRSSEAQWFRPSWRYPCILSQMCSSCLSQLGLVSAIYENTSTNKGLHGIFRKLVSQHMQNTCNNSISATGIDKLAPLINMSSLHKGLDEGYQQLSVTFYFSASIANHSYPDGLLPHQICCHTLFFSKSCRVWSLSLYGDFGFLLSKAVCVGFTMNLKMTFRSSFISRFFKTLECSLQTLTIVYALFGLSVHGY